MNLEDFIDLARRIDSNEIERLLANSGFQQSRDQRPLKVMISSTRRGLERERDALDDALSRISDIELRLFEKLDSGHANVEESLRLVRECDIFLAIFDPSNHGSPIPDGPHKSKFYSQLEFEAAGTRKLEPPSDWPLLFVFVKGSEPLAGWHSEVLLRFNIAETDRFSCVDDLRVKTQALLIAHNIEIRSTRVKQLAHRLEMVEGEKGRTELALSSKTREAEFLTGQLAEQRQSLLKQHEKLAEALNDAHSAGISHVQASIDKTREADRNEMSVLREKLIARGRGKLATVMVGIVLGALPMLAVVALIYWGQSGDLDRRLSDLTGTLTGSLDKSTLTLATALQKTPLFVSGLDADPMLLAQKLWLASSLNSEFDCRRRDVDEFPITSLPGPRVTLVRDSVCVSDGPLILRAYTVGMPACGHAAAISADWWVALRKKVEGARLKVHMTRLVGHASSERITATCGPVPADLLKSPDAGPTRRDFLDGQISSNGGLAYVRAWQQAQEFGAGKEPTLFEIDSLGVLDASRVPAKPDRRVSLSIRVGRAP